MADAPVDTAVDVVLPCLDEAAALPWVLSRLPEGYRAVVADNGSTDGSPDVARAHGATVVAASPRGFGAAVHAGVVASTAEVVCVLDADGSLDPQQLPRLVARLSGADLVLGRRRAAPGSMSPHVRLGNAVVAAQVRRRTGAPVHDIAPMRAFRREAVLGLDLQDRRSGYPLEMVVRAAQAGWRIVEETVDYAARTGRSKVTGTPLGTARAVRDMSRVLRSL